MEIPELPLRQFWFSSSALWPRSLYFEAFQIGLIHMVGHSEIGHRKPNLEFVSNTSWRRLTSSQVIFYSSIEAETSFAHVKEPHFLGSTTHFWLSVLGLLWCCSKYSCRNPRSTHSGTKVEMWGRLTPQGGFFGQWRQELVSKGFHFPVPRVDNFLKLILHDSLESSCRNELQLSTGMTSCVIHSCIGSPFLLFLSS